MKQGIYRTEESRRALMAFTDSVMGLWTFEYTAQFVPTRFGQTHVVTTGKKENPALFLLHGSASNLLSWGAALFGFADDFYVVAADIPGEAGKSEPIRPSWKGDDYALWLEDVLKALDIGNTSLMGISFGGFIALQYAAIHPERVDKIALFTPAGIVTAKSSAVFKTILYTMQGQRGAEKLKRMVFGLEEVPPVLSQFFDMLQTHFAPRFGSPPVITDGRIKRIKAPVFMISGGKDAFFAVQKASVRLKRLLPDARISIIPEGQHVMMASYESVVSFLKGGV